MLIEKLVDFGFTEKEAKIYVALLGLEVATANEIALKTEINRSSTYVVLEALKKQGYVNMTVDKFVKQYVATPPDVLLHLAEKRAEKQESIKKTIENILPDLRALHKDTKHKPKVMVYEGNNNLRALFSKESFNVNDEWRTYEDVSEVDKYLPGYIKEDCLVRKGKGVKLRAISPDTRNCRETVDRYKKMGSSDKILLIPLDKFKSPKHSIDFYVFGDEVSFSSLQESFAIVIKHQEIADTLKNIFDLAWEEAKRLDQKK